MREKTHTITIIKMMLEKGEITACQIPISNANQYFGKLEALGISASRDGMLGESKVKWRFIPADNKNKALKYIGIASTDNAQGSH